MAIRPQERRQFWVGDVRKEDGREVADIDRTRAYAGGEADGRAEYMLQHALERMEQGYADHLDPQPFDEFGGLTREYEAFQRLFTERSIRIKHVVLRYGPSTPPCPTHGRHKCLICHLNIRPLLVGVRVGHRTAS